MARDPFAIQGASDPAQFARNGIEYISDTVAHAVPCYYFHAYIDCVIAAITAPLAGGNTLVGQTIPAGHDLPLVFTSIQLTSGRGFGAKL